MFKLFNIESFVPIHRPCLYHPGVPVCDYNLLPPNVMQGRLL